jgi:hypothetical protein
MKLFLIVTVAAPVVTLHFTPADPTPDAVMASPSIVTVAGFPVVVTDNAVPTMLGERFAEGDAAFPGPIIDSGPTVPVVLVIVSALVYAVALPATTMYGFAALLVATACAISQYGEAAVPGPVAMQFLPALLSTYRISELGAHDPSDLHTPELHSLCALHPRHAFIAASHIGAVAVVQSCACVAISHATHAPVASHRGVDALLAEHSPSAEHERHALVGASQMGLVASVHPDELEQAPARSAPLKSIAMSSGVAKHAWRLTSQKG